MKPHAAGIYILLFLILYFSILKLSIALTYFKNHFSLYFYCLLRVMREFTKKPIWVLKDLLKDNYLRTDSFSSEQEQNCWSYSYHDILGHRVHGALQELMVGKRTQWGFKSCSWFVREKMRQLQEKIKKKKKSGELLNLQLNQLPFTSLLKYPFNKTLIQ